MTNLNSYETNSIPALINANNNFGYCQTVGGTIFEKPINNVNNSYKVFNDERQTINIGGNYLNQQTSSTPYTETNGLFYK